MLMQVCFVHCHSDSQCLLKNGYSIKFFENFTEPEHRHIYRHILFGSLINFHPFPFLKKKTLIAFIEKIFFNNYFVNTCRLYFSIYVVSIENEDNGLKN